MQVTMIEINMNSERMRDLIRYPAVSSHTFQNEVYFLKNGKIVGHGVVHSSYNGAFRVGVDKTHQETVDFFKDDVPFQTLGEHASWRFDDVTGEYIGTYTDEDANRGEGLSIVDRWEFDYGYHSKLRYGDIPGFGAKRNEEVNND